MSTLEFSEQFARMGAFANKVHNCKICPFFSTSLFLMVNHVRRHRRPPLAPFNCEQATVEVFHCKDCNFRTDLTACMKKHIKRRHVPPRSDPSTSEEDNRVQKYNCTNCDFETHFALKYLQHASTCPKPKPTKAQKGGPQKTMTFACNQCDYKTNRQYILEIHRVTQHLKHKKKKLYRRHSQRDSYKSGPKIHKCIQCWYQSSRHSQLRMHVILKHTRDSEIKWFHCDKCSYKAKTGELLTRHKKSLHQPSYNCDKCDHKYKEKEDLHRHIDQVHSQSVAWFHCRICKFVTKSVETLNEHINEHKTGKYLYKCDKCRYETKIHDEFQQHQLIQHPDKPKPQFNCDLCEFETECPEILKKHSDTNHPKQKLYQCDGCPHQVRRISELREHMKDKHPTPDEIKWFECSFCNFKLKSNNDLNRHVQKHHSEATVWYKCDWCPHKAKTMTDLRKHINCKHLPPDEIKWFECTFCSFKLKSNNDLNKHVQKHHSQASEWYKCDRCNFKSYSTEKLQQHKDRHQSLEEILHKHDCSLNQQYYVAREAGIPANANAAWYYCHVCKFTTKFSEIFDEHVSGTQDLTSEMECHLCTECEYRGTSAKALTDHVLLRHTARGEASKDVPHSGQALPDLVLLPQERPNKKLTVYKCGSCVFYTRCVKALSMHIICNHAK